MLGFKEFLKELHDVYIKNTKTLSPQQKGIRLKKKKKFKSVKEIDPVKVVNQYARNKGK